MIIYVVKPGDSVYSIAQQYGISPDIIISDNELQNPERLVVGQTLVLRTGTRGYSLRPGDSLYNIARRFGIPVSRLLALNPQVSSPTRLMLGQIIQVPTGTMQKLGTIQVNGYAFPSIPMETLERTLPSLTYLAPFSYEAERDGTLVPPEDAPLIEAARAQGTAPLMVITNIEPGESFSSDLATILLNNMPVQNQFIDNIIAELQGKNYYGLDVDFEYLYPGDRERYVAFLRRITDTLHELGYSVSVALAPKTSADQQGLLYEAHDYEAIGAIVDHVILMTYEWGYTYGPPLAVAPINEVRKVLDYAVTAIEPKKILLGIPNYGYEWVLPYEEGTAATAVTNVGAVEIAARENAAIQYDETAQAPFFTFYGDDGRERIVWFEDARSIDAKLRLINEYGLGGASYWTIGTYFPQNWLVLNSLYNVEKLL